MNWKADRRLGLAALCLAASSWLAGCGHAAVPSDRLVVGIAVGPNNFDPRIGSDEASQRVHQLIFASLFRLDEHLRVVPDLAASTETPDPRTYVVGLRPGVVFHDGRPLTADDVVFTFQSFLDPAFLSPRKGAYRLLESVRALDTLHVEFRLREPFGSFPINLVMGIVPKHAANVSAHPIGAGPYVFERALPDDRVELKRFDDYFGEPAANAGLVLKVIPDDTMRGLELQKGSVDLVVNDLPPDIVHQLRLEGRLRLVTAAGTDYAYVGINFRDPALTDVRVRRALGYAVDASAIVKYLRRELALPAVGILPPMSWAFDADVPVFQENLAKAAELLDAAGFPDPDGPGPRSRLSLSLKTSTAEFVRLQGSVLQAQWRRVGIQIDVQSQEFATLYADVLSGNFQLFTLQWVGVSDPDMLRRTFHSNQVPPAGFNRGHFADAEVDRLIDEATRTTDDAVRRSLYGAAQRRIAEAVPYVSLWYKTNVAVYQPSLDGVRLTPTADFGALKDVYRIGGATTSRLH
ncbi:MAG: ABC transporter substrate-binding protein [Vicinamibacterales bacterium]